ncbi:hypothetical protein A2982_02385 [candidate division WWE3 bacterium RIFCSPLOWO2_01_FULL_39_13]|uniref:Uncharacterized protein n=1 Tax=candidate division WWE3 bacterium RIFCSPLOWO2_01_FULL_39_13 TaxID=1802624 RepID=A0A1F4V3N3_UNCKA|nr:MAG: hypothetical protein A2982_02385 [candidate division WWE3 bacterium RIFCSPLOWO2_01_FULL_39_13]
MGIASYKITRGDIKMFTEGKRDNKIDLILNDLSSKLKINNKKKAEIAEEIVGNRYNLVKLNWIKTHKTKKEKMVGVFIEMERTS